MNMMFDLGFVETTMLAGVRIVAFIVVAPPFNLPSFPAQVKVALALGLAMLVGPRAQELSGHVPGSLLAEGSMTFVGTLVMQLVAGLALGFLVRLVFAAVQTAGSFIDVFGGFQLAHGFDPMSNTEGAIFARFYHLAAIALLFASNGYQLVLGGIVRSFKVLPLTGTLNIDSMSDTLINGLSEVMVSALQIAGPLIAVLFLTDVGLGLLTRVAPALNAFALGFPLKIFVTLSLGSIAFLALPNVIATLTERAANLVSGVSS